MRQTERAKFAVWEVGAVAAGLAVLLLIMVNRYGPHRDQLYFVSAATWPGVIRISRRLPHWSPGSLRSWRRTSARAQAAEPDRDDLARVCAAAFARLLGGGRGAQLLTA